MYLLESFYVYQLIAMFYSNASFPVHVYIFYRNIQSSDKIVTLSGKKVLVYEVQKKMVLPKTYSLHLLKVILHLT